MTGDAKQPNMHSTVPTTLVQPQTWVRAEARKPWSVPWWDTHQCALKVEGVSKNHIRLPILDLEEAGALGGAAILCGGLSSRGRGLAERRKTEH